MSQDIQTRIQEHINRARQANSHEAKVATLTKLLEDLFDVKLEELLPGIEKKLRSKVFGLKGSVDLLFSIIAFEIKVDLQREIEDAKKKLLKYLQILYERRPSRNIGIITDGLKFKAFSPVLENGKVIDLSPISSVNLAEASTSESVLWLDSFIFSKPRIEPSARDLKFRFGPYSPTYSLASNTLMALWKEIEDEEDAKLKLELWRKSLEIVYGSQPIISAFIGHTYLVSLVKLIVYYLLSIDNLATPERLRPALTGEYFTSYGISNLIEEDFFVWILHPKIIQRSLELVSNLAKQLFRYDFSQINEDFFKEIYQDLLEYGQRHRIGEYYTPEWLVQLTLRKALALYWREHKDFPSILDPACGSGTFLTNAVRIARKWLNSKGKNNEETLSWIVNNINGVDVNPLAVIIARANYLLALGDLLWGKKVTVPIWVSDSIRLPEKRRSLSGNVYEFLTGVRERETANQYLLQLPERIARESSSFNQVMNAFQQALGAFRKTKDQREAIALFQGKVPSLSPGEEDTLKMTLDTIFKLIDKPKPQDAIWLFMLSNIYIPIALSERKFDLVIGNPPWIAMRYIENPSYQNFLKKLVLSTYQLLESKQVHLFTHIECATLFFCRASELYLNEGGIIAFVMPRSVLTGSMQHAAFREFLYPPIKLFKILDMKDVSPVFNVPSCVLIGVKNQNTSYPVQADGYKGELPEKNIKLADARAHLSSKVHWYKPRKMEPSSPYHSQIKAGAAIYPRCFYFIEFEILPLLGTIDQRQPAIVTSSEIQGKEPWTGTQLQGNVEAKFIYATLLGGDVVPFVYTKLRPVVLPIEPTSQGYTMLDIQSLRQKGYSYTANWLENIQKIWKEKRTLTSEKNFPSVLDRLNYQSLLTLQHPEARYLTVYNTSGTNLVSCVIDRENLPSFQEAREQISPAGFVAERTTMWYETTDEDEAHYLCAILNAPKLNEAIKPLQTEGKLGPRDISRRPFTFFIPKFDSSSIHKDLAELSKTCHAKVTELTFTKRKIGNIRTEVKKALKGELDKIDEEVVKVINLNISP